MRKIISFDKAGNNPPEKISEYVQLEDGKLIKEGDPVTYVPMHARGNPCHRDCEKGIVSSIRDGGVWVRYEKQHPSQPGQKTPIENLRYR